MRKAVLISICCLLSIWVWAQATNCTPVCNDHIYASMPSNICERSIIRDDVLENSTQCGAPYIVQLIYPFGTTQFTPSQGFNKLDRTHIGYTMVYKVTEQFGTGSCWGYITVEDKSGPPIVCKNATISCFQVASINDAVLGAQDACSGAATKVTSSFSWRDYGCDSVGIIGRVFRTIVASDAWGNQNFCNDVLTIRKDTLGNVCAPSTMIKLPCRLYCLNGAKVIQYVNAGAVPISTIGNINNWDLVEFSKDKTSPNYPTPDLLLKIQGKGDALVEKGLIGRLSGTKGLGQDIIPNFAALPLPTIPLGAGLFCLQLDTIVPMLNDSILDVRKIIKSSNFSYNPAIQTVQFFSGEVVNPDFCRLVPGKTKMYPALGALCKLTVNYYDEILNICGAGFKIRREWRIADWCTGKEVSYIQYITIADEEDPKPVFSAAPGVSAIFSSNQPGIKDTIVYYKTVNPHDCNSNFVINRLNVWDCSKVKQSYTFKYADPGHPGKIIVLTKDLGNNGASISLPAGIHIGKISLIDECFNTCNFPLMAFVGDITPPNPVCDEFTQATVDPATCWARVYARDLDNGSKDNCCDRLHFAVTRMDSLEVHRKEYTDHIMKICGWQEYIDHKFAYDFIVEHYLSIYDFADYIDLTECGNNQVVLRVFDNCYTALYDPHITSLSEHEWYMAQIYGYYPINYLTVDPFLNDLQNLETQFNYEARFYLDNVFKVNLNHPDKCPALLSSKLLAALRVAFRQFTDKVAISETIVMDLNNQYNETFNGVEGTFCVPEFKIKFQFNLTSPLLPASLNDIISIEKATANYSSLVLALCRSVSSDCMINILVDDKTPPVCEDPADVYWYCDNVGGAKPNFNTNYEYAYDACNDFNPTNNDEDNIEDYTCRDGKGLPYNQIECVKENDDNLSDHLDPTNKEFGWYGCNIYGPAGHMDEHGEAIEPCQPSDRMVKVTLEENKNIGVNNWAPIYCHSWLCLDRYDQGDAAGTLIKVKPQTAFFSPVIRSGSRGENVGTKQFIVWDNCWIDSAFVMKDEQFIDKCDNGWLKRTWTFKDKCGSTVSCDQKIITRHRSDFEVMFPEDVTANCDSDSNLKPSFTGSPMVMDDECELIGVNYEDEIFTVVQDACYKIIRTWKIIDWCKYDPNQHKRNPDVIVDDRAVADKVNRFCIYRKLKDDGDGYITYTQIIKVVDNVVPVIAPCKNDTVCIFNGYNGAGPEINPLCTVPSYTSPDFKATDNCTAADQISFRWELDVDNDGKDFIKSGPNQKRFTSNNLKEGIHNLIVIAEDNCGNESTTSCLITVRDCKKPTPYCYNGIATVIMPSTGSVTVWATDLNAGSYDNCTRKDSLRFSFDAEGLEASRVFTCVLVPNGIIASNELDVYVWDQTGNVDHCRTYLSIQDGSEDICPDNAAVTAAVSGKVITETTEPVENVILQSKTSNNIPSFKTDVKGSYAFSGLPVNSNVSIIPSRDDDPMNGVSTLDLVVLQKHILGLEKLQSPYKYIAADVDRSNEITTLDLLELRKLVLTLYDKLPKNTSWRFVPKAYTFSDIYNPWFFAEKIDITGLSKDEINKDFIGIKIGDINGTVVPHSLLGNESRQNGTALKFSTEDRSLKLGEESTISFTAENFQNISGYQFTLKINGLDIKSIVPGILNVNESNFGMRRINEGVITTSWNDVTGATKGISAGNHDILFSIKVKATKDLTLSESLVINSKYTRAEAYDGNTSLGVVLEVGKKPISGYTLHQNVPNPFKASTMISYELAKANKVSLKITDVTGRVVRVYTQDGVKGYNQLKVNRADLNAVGVLYYTLETENFTATKKMVIIE